MPLGRMSKIDQDVDASRSVQSGIKTLDVIGSDENKPAGKKPGSISETEGPNENWKRTGLPRNPNWSGGHSGLRNRR